MWAPAEVAPADDAQVWAPAVAHSMQCGSIAGDIFGSSSVPASSYSSGGQQQLVDYNYHNYYAAAAQHHDPDPVDIYVDPDPVETYIDTKLMAHYINSPEKLFQEKEEEFKNDANFMKMKMHRYPPSIQDLGDVWYPVPKVVAIGPYYHGQDHLQKAEKSKHVAALYCINNNPSLSIQDLYDAVVSTVVEIDARGLYDKDVMAGIGYEEDFLPMMFFDACFLVIYILWKSGSPMDAVLFDFFESNDNDISLDIMLLENQIPLQVVEAVINMCTAEPLEVMKKFIVTSLQEHSFLQDLDQDYYNEAPHLLGLLRFYAVGKRRRRSRQLKVTSSDLEKMESISFSAGAVELSKMFIFSTANETTKLPDMGFERKWIMFGELSMAPLSLHHAHAGWLVNMAAFELCTTPNFLEAEFEDSAVCSYLLLLCMLIHKKEDVDELRTKGILRGGAGLNNKQTLDFFKSLQSLRRGPCYYLVMIQIQNYMNKRLWIKAYTFVYTNWKYIVAFSSAVSGFIGVTSGIMTFKGH